MKYMKNEGAFLEKYGSFFNTEPYQVNCKLCGEMPKCKLCGDDVRPVKCKLCGDD